MGQTALERHAAFFDRNEDGYVDPPETAEAIISLGVGEGWAWLLTGLIHGALGPMTNDGFGLRINLARINRGIHRGDTGAFDAQGRFDRTRFEAMFSEALPDAPPDALRFADFDAIMRERARDRPANPVEVFFSWAEAKVFFQVAADGVWEGQPTVSKRRLRSFYEGRLFPAIARLQRIRKAGAHD